MSFNTFITQVLRNASVNSRNGAPLGRRDSVDPADMFLFIEPMQMEDGDYDAGGAYWGSGSEATGYMWVAVSANAVDPAKYPSTVMFCRATHLFDAITQFREKLRDAEHLAPDVVSFITYDSINSPPDVEVMTDSRALLASLVCPAYHPGLYAGFMQAVRFTEHDRLYNEAEELIDVDAAEFAPRVQNEAMEIFDTFWRALATDPNIVAVLDLTEYPSAEQVGMDLWLSMNGYGTGFLDRGRQTIWTVLQRAAKQVGPRSVFVNAEGQLDID